MNAFLRENPVTPRQRQFLRFVANYANSHGYPPSIRGICEHFKVRSTNSAAGVLDALERKGLLARKEKSARTLAVTDAGWRFLYPPKKPALMSGSEVA